MRSSKIRRVLVTGVVATFAVMAVAAPASADAVFHTERIPLASVGGAPLQSGFVIDIHANGPQIYAHERYVLNGATPETTYQVTLWIFPFDPTCASTPAPIPTAMLQTNVSGNGTAEHFFAPADVPPALRGHTHGGIWQLTTGGSVAYQTGCISIALD